MREYRQVYGMICHYLNVTLRHNRFILFRKHITVSHDE